MSYKVLARKWRPQSFKDLVGQEHVVQALVNGLDQDRVHHAFLLTGTRGVGKTTIARIMAKCLNCDKGVSSTPCGECSSCVDIDAGRFIDMMEIDAASKTKVDDTREMLDSVQFTPTRGRYKVYIIDEVHMLSGHSFNALLKTLEEPPPHVKFILATTDPQKLPVTILSRCLRFTLTRLLPDQISGHISHILEAEEVPSDDSAVMRIARAADGSMRDGLSLLDQAIAFGGGNLKDDEVASMLGSIDHVHIAAIVDALIDSDGNALMQIVNDLAMQSRKLETVLDELAESMHRIAMIQAAPEFRDPERADWDSLTERSARLTPEDVQLYYQIAISGRRDLGLAPDPRTGLEMTLLRMLAFRPAEAGSEALAQPAVSKPAASGETQAATKSATATQSAAPTQGRVSGLSGAQQAMVALAELENPGKRAQSKRASAAHAPSDPAPPTVDPAPSTVAEPDIQSAFASQAGTKTRPEPEPEPALENTVSDPQDSADWNNLQTSLNLSGAARELARNMQLESAVGKNWRFLVPDTLRDMGSDSVVASLQSALSERVGHPVLLDLHTAKEPLQSVARQMHEAEVTRMSDAERAIADDPTVQQLKDKFAATIVADSIQPIQ